MESKVKTLFLNAPGGAFYEELLYFRFLQMKSGISVFFSPFGTRKRAKESRKEGPREAKKVRSAKKTLLEAGE